MIEALQRVRHLALIGGDRPGNIDRDDDIGAPAQVLERQRVGRAAVDQHLTVDLDRTHDGRQRDRSRERAAQRAVREHHLAPEI
jgi:hypothetical protein